MGDWIARVVGIRTTGDGGGHARGIVTGIGATPQLALAELRREAEGLAQQAGQEAQAAQEADKKAAEERAATRAAQQAQERAKREEELARTTRRASQNQGGPRRLPAERIPRKQPPVTPVDGTPPVASGPREWRFEVLDVRLTPALTEGGGCGWLAYGTLAEAGHAQQASTIAPGRDSQVGPPSDRGDRGNRGNRADPSGLDTR